MSNKSTKQRRGAVFAAQAPIARYDQDRGVRVWHSLPARCALAGRRLGPHSVGHQRPHER
jgi:hypothetical protein